MNKFKPFCYIYVGCAIVTVKTYLEPLRNLIIRGDWAMTRYSHYLYGNVTVYNNFFERVCIAACLYFFILFVIVSMLMIKEKKDFKLGLIVLIAAVISNFMQALYVVGRGTIFNGLLLIFSIFLFVIKGIDKKKLKVLIILFIIAMVIIIPYMIEITESRFSTNATNEMLRYFGEAPVVFNVNVTTSDRLALGAYSFSRLLNTGFDQALIEGTWGWRFFTFAGYIYIDWGYFGMIVFGLIFGVFLINRIVRKRKYKISDLLLIFYYYDFLIKGGLVIGSSFLTDTIAIIIIFVLVRLFIEKSKLPNIRFKIRRV